MALCLIRLTKIEGGNEYGKVMGRGRSVLGGRVARKWMGGMGGGRVGRKGIEETRGVTLSCIAWLAAS